MDGWPHVAHNCLGSSISAYRSRVRLRGKIPVPLQDIAATTRPLMLTRHNYTIFPKGMLELQRSGYLRWSRAAVLRH